MHPEEKKYLANMSDIERKILQKTHKEEHSKKLKYASLEFKWWNYDDKDTYFVLTTKRKNTFKKGD
jgi:hypothetical protein